MGLMKQSMTFMSMLRRCFGMPRQIYSGDALYKVELAELIILSRECHLSQDKANTSISATFLTNRTLHDANRHIPSQALGRDVIGGI
jgi:hypothetical protein